MSLRNAASGSGPTSAEGLRPDPKATNLLLVRPRSRSAVVVLATVLAVLWMSAVDARDKIDVVTLLNGDQITGELKDLNLGVLTVSTDHVGTVSIEWVAVASIESTQFFDVILSDGKQMSGTFEPGAADGMLELTDGDGDATTLEVGRVARVTQLGRTQWKRWRGNVSVGASFTSSNSQRDVTLDAEATYRDPRFRLRNTLTGSISDVDEGTRNSWGTFASNYQQYLKKRWFWYALLQFDRNEGLDLDLRTTTSVGGGRYLVSTARSQLYTSLGLAAVKEVYSTTDDDGGWSTELDLTGDYQLYIFEGRDTTVGLSLSILPSLSVSNRYRIAYSAALQRKLVSNFTVSLNLNGSYDSKPPQGSLASDTSLSLNLGWSN